LEQTVAIERNVMRAPTLRDIEVLERKKLGPSWGRKRRKFYGPR